MARVRDLLYRFRPSAAPGAANPAGVPVDRALEQSTELEPVLGLLAATERECEDVVDAARDEATAIRTRCADEALSILGAARSSQAAERAAAAARVQRRGRLQAGREGAVTPQQRVGQWATRLMPDQVETVVGSVRSMLGEGVPAAVREPGPP